MMFSIVIPTYDRGDLLKQTLDSLVNQTYKQFEVIVVDDGSKENIGLIVENFNRLLEISYIRLPCNRGEANAVNIGWELAKSDYIAVINSDDPQIENWLLSMKEGIGLNPGYGFYYPNRVVIDAYNIVQSTDQLYNWSKKTLYGKMIPISSAGMILRKGALPQEYLPRKVQTIYPSDLMQMLELGQLTEGLLLQNSWGVWRQHSDSISGSNSFGSKSELFKSNLIQWIDKNSALVNKYSNLSSAYSYVYAQYFKLRATEEGVLSSAFSTSSLEFLNTLVKNPKMNLYLLKILVNQLSKLLVRKPNKSISSAIFSKHN
jgi:glycosyltransferase involved in cell wall biosynthesis